ncbi:biotin-dependent carboxyltransferase family protein [Nocardioides bruguierae]|uniref:Biotin-dependent carboxyltransferase family protein n=1 Tax=Nocardioides bruguierae TaxID=2945102 RepID=A0A9X2ICI0_9ACTN|nr:biotin-dependent carboxyltransferase family protein [Nocardioides bruguierae]MCL8024304.1 biotin-dependent carboxyltransferase family protein [Nocardioides bruguierae]MCM0618726.1 biotin-dependent carboxyltransferase family protein [Nocardioides bruguierae]
MSGLLVERVGGPVLVVDDGRPGWAHLGVPRSGPADPAAADLARRLVGAPGSALLEVVLGGLALRLRGPGRWVALTGAPAPLLVDGRARPVAEPVWAAPGARITLGHPPTGLRSWLALGGGVDVPAVLGSRSGDTLSGLGPRPLEVGQEVALLEDAGRPAPLDVPPPAGSGPLRLHPGPRPDWRGPDPRAHLARCAWEVAADSDRVGVRLAGPALPLTRTGELASEAVVLGAVQVPPSGTPVVFGPDHPTTGGYPVVAVVDPRDLPRLLQARPGEQVRFRRA